MLDKVSTTEMNLNQTFSLYKFNFLWYFIKVVES